MYRMEIRLGGRYSKKNIELLLIAFVSFRFGSLVGCKGVMA